MSTCLCVFLKAPRAGHVKTRLAATIGAGLAAELYRAFVLDTFSWVAGFPASERRVEYSPRDRESQCRELLAKGRLDWTLHPQARGDLGKRLRAAFSSMFRAGHERCVVIGTDCPTLGTGEARQAFRELECADLVLGPTFDGGYYLIGLRRPVPELFEAVPWSTERVFELTLERARDSGLVTRTLATHRDVDTAGDLPPLYAELISRWRAGRLPFPVHTFRTLEWRLTRYRSP